MGVCRGEGRIPLGKTFWGEGESSIIESQTSHWGAEVESMSDSKISDEPAPITGSYLSQNYKPQKKNTTEFICGGKFQTFKGSFSLVFLYAHKYLRQVSSTRRILLLRISKCILIRRFFTRVAQIENIF